MNTNYVAMAQEICPICGITHEHSNELLLDKRLRSIPEDKRITGYGLCEEHDKLFQDGYIALVGADESKSTFKDNGNMDFNSAHRTGHIIHLKRDVFNNMFNTELSEDQEMVFIDQEVIALLEKMNNELE